MGLSNAPEGRDITPEKSKTAGNEVSDQLAEKSISPEIFRAAQRKNAEIKDLYEQLKKSQNNVDNVKVTDQSANVNYEFSLVELSSIEDAIQITKGGSSDNMKLTSTNDLQIAWTGLGMLLNGESIAHVKEINVPSKPCVGQNVEDLLKKYDKFIGLMKLELQRADDQKRRKAERFSTDTPSEK